MADNRLRRLQIDNQAVQAAGELGMRGKQIEAQQAQQAQELQFRRQDSALDRASRMAIAQLSARTQIQEREIMAEAAQEAAAIRQQGALQAASVKAMNDYKRSELAVTGAEARLKSLMSDPLIQDDIAIARARADLASLTAKRDQIGLGIGIMPKEETGAKDSTAIPAPEDEGGAKAKKTNQIIGRFQLTDGALTLKQ